MRCVGVRLSTDRFLPVRSWLFFLMLHAVMPESVIIPCTGGVPHFGVFVIFLRSAVS
jgi:hypothetical protein